MTNRLDGAAILAMITIEPCDPGAPEARACIGAYFAELAERFETGFDPAITSNVDEAALTPPAGVLLVARLRGEAVGCGALRLNGSAPAEIKRMWVAPPVRGIGLARRLLAELEHRAARAGATTVRLDTNRVLVEAISLYRRAGYRDIEAFNEEPYAHFWFEKSLQPER